MSDPHDEHTAQCGHVRCLHKPRTAPMRVGQSSTPVGGPVDEAALGLTVEQEARLKGAWFGLQTATANAATAVHRNATLHELLGLSHDG